MTTDQGQDVKGHKVTRSLTYQQPERHNYATDGRINFKLLGENFRRDVRNT